MSKEQRYLVPWGAPAERHVDWMAHPCRALDATWQKLREVIFRRDGEECQYCGNEDGPFEIDHIVPRSRGGTNEHDNLIVACQHCNRSKGNKMPSEWLA